MHDLGLTYLFVATLAGGALVVGGLLVSGGLVAPVAVSTLDESSAARFLRAFWPRYYRLGVAGGLVLTLILGMASPVAPVGAPFGFVLTTLAGVLTTCLWLALRMIPGINAARDAGETARFDRLHRVVLGLTGVGLLAGLACLAGLGWVLPGA